MLHSAATGRSCLVLLIALASVAAGACAAPFGSPHGAAGNFSPIAGAELLVRGVRDTSPAVGDDEVAGLASANAAFALDLYRALATGHQDNIVIGPHSISSALAMVHAGARGQTATDMAAVLHFDTLSGDVGPLLNALDLALHSRSADPAVNLRLANQAFAEPGQPFLDSYLATLGRDFGAPMAELAFGDPEAARRVINGWAAERTNNRVTDLFPAGSLSPDTVLVLANAISLDAQWRFQFPAERTYVGKFHLADGGTIDVPMMTFEYSLPLVWANDYAAVELLYGRGDLSMVVILPQDLAAFEAALDRERLQGIFDEISDRGIHLALPRFAFKSHTDLDTTLRQLGMTSAYEAADFSGMTGAPGLSLGTVQHEAFIEVDEQGTEAHAASGAGVPISHGPTITFDRPFFFVIRDRLTGAILFVGRLADPRR